jgi:type IV pilus biogenesis protein CpaD/CtpE
MTPFKIALAVLVAALAAGCGGRKQPSHTNKDVAVEIQRAMNVRAVSNNVPGSAFVCTQHAKGESPLPMF